MKAALVVALVLTSSACALHYPPLPAPQQVAPVSPSGNPPSGQIRVLADANGERARLTADGTTVCEHTPCSFDTAPGLRRLTFFDLANPKRHDEVELDLTGASKPRTVAVRRTLGVRREASGFRTASIVSFALGGSLLAVGGVVASVQLVDRSSASTWSTTGGAVALSGLVALALGLGFALASRPHVWPGATRSWTVVAPQ